MPIAECIRRQRADIGAGSNPRCTTTPGPVQDQARISAEQAQHAANTLHQPSLAHAADDAFIHAMNVSAIWTMLIALSGAAVLVTALRRDKESSWLLTSSSPVPARTD
jgi:hypothetical protein